ncbi:MAG: hypothetical protein ACRCT8_00460 [Lacipirellulaceae bacterium]
MAARSQRPITAPRGEPPAQCVATGRQYASTYACSAALVIATLVLLRQASDFFGERGFAEFVLSRRYLSALTPILSLGMSVALAKQVPMRRTAVGLEATHALLAASIQIVTLCCALSYAAVCLAPEGVSRLVTGEPGNASLLASLIASAMGLLWTTCTTAYCRGMLWNHCANAIQFIGVALLPVGLVVASTSPELFFWGNGVVLVLGNALALPLALGFPLRKLAILDPLALRSLVAQGAPRAPGDAAFFALLAMPAVVATHGGGIEHAAELAYGLAMLTLMTQIVAPQNQLLLPEATYLLQAGDRPRLRRRVAMMAGWSIAVTSFVVVAVELFADQLVATHLGIVPRSFVDSLRMTVPAAVALNLFLCLRGVVDATSRRPVAPNLCVAAFAVFVAAQWLLAAAGWGDAALVGGLWVATGMLAVSSCVAVVTALQGDAERVAAVESELPSSTHRATPELARAA